MTLYTQVSSNRGKTVFFLLLFSLLFLGIGWFASYYFDSQIILLVVAAVVIVQGIVSWWFSDSIALLSAKAVPLDQDPSRKARVTRLTETLVITAGLPMPRLYLIDDTAMNAFATGRDRQHGAIALTTGLVDQLNDNELSGVIAHELSHIGNEDIRLMSMVMVMAGVVALLSDVILRSMFYGNRRSREDEGNTQGVILIVGIALAILAPLFATLIQLAISRKREFMADANAVLLTRYPEGMISALRKISGDEEALEVANRGNAFMYFANPLKGQWLASLFATHPPIEQRIAALEKGSGMEEQRG